MALGCAGWPSPPYPSPAARERRDRNHAPGLSNTAEVVLAHIFCPPLNPHTGEARPESRAGASQCGRSRLARMFCPLLNLSSTL